MGRAASVCCGVVSLCLVACGEEPSVGMANGHSFVDWAGDVLVTRADDLEALAGAERLGGDLRIQTADLRVIELPALKTVGGDLSIEVNGRLERIDLRALAEVGGRLSLVGNSKLGSVELPALARVNGGLLLAGNHQLMRTQGWPNLTVIDGDVVITDNAELRGVGLGAVAAIGGSLHVYDNPQLLGTAGLGQLQSVGGEVSFAGNAELGAISLTELQAIGADLLLFQNPELAHLDAPVLDTVAGDVWVMRNRSLPTCEMELLLCQLRRGTLGGEVTVVDTDDVASCGAGF